MSDNPIPSPCLTICVRENNACTACFRTMDEIMCWAEMSDAQKMEVWARILPLLKNAPLQKQP